MKADHFKFAVLVSANAEWKAVKVGFPDARIENSLYGQCFFEQVDKQPVLFCHGGWGKVAAAASTQYVIRSFQSGVPHQYRYVWRD